MAATGDYSKVELALNEQLFPTKKINKRTQEEIIQPVERQAAWIDDDDEDVTIDLENTNRLRKLRKTEDETEIQGDVYQQRLKKQFESGRSAATWADIDSIKKPRYDSDGEEEMDIFANSNTLIETSKEILMPGHLDIGRVKDANQHGVSNAVVQSVQFHPNGQLLLTAGLDKTLRLFQIDGSNNNKVDSIFIQDMPITCAKYSTDGTRIVMTGPRKFFYSYDIEGGIVSKIPKVIGRKERKWNQFVTSENHLALLGDAGVISLLSPKSYEWIGSIKLNGKVRSASFCTDENYLLSTGSDGDIYKWDMRTRRCLYRVNDEGSLGSGVITSSNNGKYAAVGADSGVVNLYDHSLLGENKTPKPLKSLMQLTTSISTLKFNSDSQILVMASNETKDSLRMVHLPSMTIFSNWPSARTPLHFVSSLDFSPSSGYLACGNARGRVLLYRLNHYAST